MQLETTGEERRMTTIDRPKKFSRACFFLEATSQCFFHVSSSMLNASASSAKCSFACSSKIPSISSQPFPFLRNLPVRCRPRLWALERLCVRDQPQTPSTICILHHGPPSTNSTPSTLQLFNRYVLVQDYASSEFSSACWQLGASVSRRQSPPLPISSPHASHGHGRSQNLNGWHYVSRKNVKCPRSIWTVIEWNVPHQSQLTCGLSHLQPKSKTWCIFEPLCWRGWKEIHGLHDWIFGFLVLWSSDTRGLVWLCSQLGGPCRVWMVLTPCGSKVTGDIGLFFLRGSCK